MRHARYTRRFHENLDWIAAIDAFDYADPEPLSDLIAAEPVPAELRPVLAAIVRGDRKPDKRAGAKLKIPARDRMHVALLIFAPLAVLDEMKSGTCSEHLDGPGLAGIRRLEAAASELGQEALQTRRYFESTAREYVGYIADAKGVSTETIENILRDLQKKIESYPRV